LFTLWYVRVGILLTFENHLHHRITSPRWALKTTFTTLIHYHFPSTLIHYHFPSTLIHSHFPSTLIHSHFPGFVDWTKYSILFKIIAFIYNNVVHSVICEGWHFTHLWKALTSPHHFTKMGVENYFYRATLYWNGCTKPGKWEFPSTLMQYHFPSTLIHYHCSSTLIHYHFPSTLIHYHFPSTLIHSHFPSTLIHSHFPGFVHPFQYKVARISCDLRQILCRGWFMHSGNWNPLK
jgi:hypothetical protein